MSAPLLVRQCQEYLSSHGIRSAVNQSHKSQLFITRTIYFYPLTNTLYFAHTKKEEVYTNWSELVQRLSKYRIVRRQSFTNKVIEPQSSPGRGNLREVGRTSGTQPDFSDPPFSLS